MILIESRERTFVLLLKKYFGKRALHGPISGASLHLFLTQADAKHSSLVLNGGNGPHPP